MNTPNPKRRFRKILTKEKIEIQDFYKKYGVRTTYMNKDGKSISVQVARTPPFSLPDVIWTAAN
jgi:hypothetical protein